MSRSRFIPSLSLLPWQLCCIGRASARNSECYPGFLPGLPSPPCLCSLESLFFNIRASLFASLCWLVHWEGPPSLSEQRKPFFLPRRSDHFGHSLPSSLSFIPQISITHSLHVRYCVDGTDTLVSKGYRIPTRWVIFQPALAFLCLSDFLNCVCVCVLLHFLTTTWIQILWMDGWMDSFSFPSPQNSVSILHLKQISNQSS